MSRQIERLFWFSAGILINSFGIVLITKGALGTSQISSIPYVLSLQLPSISFGMFSFIMNMVYIVLQALLLRRQFKPIQLLQIVVNVVFSASIDVFMAMLSFYAPQQLFTRVLSAVAGCIVLAFGISVEVAPDLIMVPGEGIVAAISKVSGRRFGSVKVVFDVTLILISSSRHCCRGCFSAISSAWASGRCYLPSASASSSISSTAMCRCFSISGHWPKNRKGVIYEDQKSADQGYGTHR